MKSTFILRIISHSCDLAIHNYYIIAGASTDFSSSNTTVSVYESEAVQW